MLMKKIKMVVSGRVQGVGFRYMTKMVADQIGVTGFVRNQENGSVYIEACGSEKQIDLFTKKIKASPSPSGKVTDCQIMIDESIRERNKFDVTY